MGWKDFHAGNLFVVLLLAIADDCVNARRTGDKSNQKCNEWYSSLPATSGGVNASSSRGALVEPGQFPNIATILCENSKGLRRAGRTCGGTLISKKYILTTRFCLADNFFCGPVKYVRLGDIGSETTKPDNANMQTIRVAKTFLHPNSSDKWPFETIGLIKLVRNVKINEFVRPACLYTIPTLPEEQWDGFTFKHRRQRSGILTHLPNAVQLSTLKHDKCQISFNSCQNVSDVIVDFERQICSGIDVYQPV